MFLTIYIFYLWFRNMWQWGDLIGDSGWCDISRGRLWRSWTDMELVVVLATALCVLGVSGYRQPPKNSLTFSRGQPLNLNLTIGLILPKSTFNVRQYNRAINDAVNGLQKSKERKFHFLKKHHFTPHQVASQMFSLTPSPTGRWRQKGVRVSYDVVFIFEI